MLTLMQERGCHPSRVTLSILLHQAYLMRDSQRALHLLKLFKVKHRGLHLNPKDQEDLFKLAWRMHGFNTCRFIWRHACHDGAVTKKMEHEVTQSLMRNMPARPSNPHERWLTEAGKVIVLPLPRSARARPKSYEIITDENRIPNTPARREQRKLARQMIQEEIFNYAPGSAIGDWLPNYEMALQRDREWAEQGVLTSRPLDWKLVHVFRPPTNRMSKRRGRRSHLRFVPQHQAASESVNLSPPSIESGSKIPDQTRRPISKSETKPNSDMVPGLFGPGLGSKVKVDPEYDG